MNYTLRLLIIILLSSSSVQGQVLKGRISNLSGQPIPYSTVYIGELRQGTTSNTKGDYEIRLHAGKYTVTYQSLGYEPVLVNIEMTDKTIIENITLPVQYYQIPEVRISASGEDPAYSIMRKAIGLAPYYLNNISYYKANVYLKGNLIVNKIPRLLKKSMKMQAKSRSASAPPQIREGDAFMMETYNEIEFTAPDRYLQRVISFNSTFPDQGNQISPMQYVSASFYQPVIGNIIISPLSPNAFSHYTFRYLGATSQGNLTINKIEVIPKRKSQQLLEGTIYIIDDLWCLQSLDLTNESLVGKARIQQLYIPVQDGTWMPVSDKFEINIAIMGFKADVGYDVSVKYDDVRPNLALQKPKLISPGNTGNEIASVLHPDTTSAKPNKQIEKILSRDELTNRDMVKLSKLMQKESRKSLPDSIRNNLEIKEKTTQIIEKDAKRKDSAYWADIRPIPLSDIELKSIRISDSTRAVSSLRKSPADTTASPARNGKSKFPSILKNVAFGHTWSDSTGISFTNGGLITPKNLSFNTVDGFTYGFDFRFSKTWKEKGSFSLFPDVRWAFSRQQLMWRLNAAYRFDGVKRREIFLRTGMTSRDIGNRGGINPIINSVSSLFFEKNYLKLYESDYLTLGYRSEIVNGLTMELTAGYEARKVLENTTDFRIINSSAEYTDNVPDNPYLSQDANPVFALRDQDHGELRAKITYVPRQKYRLDKGKKIPMGSEWPTFSLSWEHGINDFNSAGYQTSHYDMIRAEIFKNHDLGAFSDLRWRIRMGAFLDNRNITFYDFFHFNPQPVPILINDYEDAFMLPSYYSMSTPEAFGEVHLKYTTPYLLLKYLPGLTKTLIRENLLLSYLGSRFSPNYTEVGYSLSEVFLLAEIGVYVGFDDLTYRSFGAKLILKFN